MINFFLAEKYAMINVLFTKYEFMRWQNNE